MKSALCVQSISIMQQANELPVIPFCLRSYRHIIPCDGVYTGIIHFVQDHYRLTSIPFYQGYSPFVQSNYTGIHSMHLGQLYWRSSPLFRAIILEINSLCLGRLCWHSSPLFRATMLEFIPFVQGDYTGIHPLCLWRLYWHSSPLFRATILAFIPFVQYDYTGILPLCLVRLY